MNETFDICAVYFLNLQVKVEKNFLIRVAFLDRGVYINIFYGYYERFLTGSKLI